MDLVVIEKNELRELMQEVIEGMIKTALRVEETLDTDGIAAFLHVSSRYIGALVDEQGLPATLIGKGYRARRKDLEAWWDKRLATEIPTTSNQ